MATRIFPINTKFVGVLFHNQDYMKYNEEGREI